MAKSKHPKDLRLKIGTKREALFTEVKDVATANIEALNKKLEIEQEMLKTAERIIKEEEKKKQKV